MHCFPVRQLAVFGDNDVHAYHRWSIVWRHVAADAEATKKTMQFGVDLMTFNWTRAYLMISSGARWSLCNHVIFDCRLHCSSTAVSESIPADLDRTVGFSLSTVEFRLDYKNFRPISRKVEDSADFMAVVSSVWIMAKITAEAKQRQNLIKRTKMMKMICYNWNLNMRCILLSASLNVDLIHLLLMQFTHSQAWVCVVCQSSRDNSL